MRLVRGRVCQSRRTIYTPELARADTLAYYFVEAANWSGPNAWSEEAFPELTTILPALLYNRSSRFRGVPDMLAQTMIRDYDPSDRS